MASSVTRRARRLLADALAAALVGGMHVQVIRGYVNGCWIAAFNRDHATVDALAPRALAHFDAYQVTFPRDDVCASVARSLLDRGRLEEAGRWARDGRRTAHPDQLLAVAVEGLAEAGPADQAIHWHRVWWRASIPPTSPATDCAIPHWRRPPGWPATRRGRSDTHEGVSRTRASMKPRARPATCACGRTAAAASRPSPSMAFPTPSGSSSGVSGVLPPTPGWRWMRPMKLRWRLCPAPTRPPAGQSRRCTASERARARRRSRVSAPPAAHVPCAAQGGQPWPIPPA